MDKYLQETDYFDIQHPVIQEIIDQLDMDGLTQKEKAIKLFYHVRDSIRYSVKPVNMKKITYTASHVLQQTSSFCIPKAVALGTLARAVEIPSRLHFVDFINHRLSPSLEKLWGTNIMAGHCYTELYIDNKWVKATAALDKETCDRHKFITVEFDGVHDALLHSVDREGNPHAEYIRDHGTHPDMSLNLIKDIFVATYGPLTGEMMKANFETISDAFA